MFYKAFSTTAALFIAIDATPAAFAAAAGHVAFDGTLSPGATGIAAVTHPGPGVYCVLPSSITIQKKQAAGKLFPQLTFDYAGSPGHIVIVSLGNVSKPGFADNCPSASYIEVIALSADGTVSTFANEAFDIAF